jgi:hypothetical protein
MAQIQGALPMKAKRLLAAALLQLVLVACSAAHTGEPEETDGKSGGPGAGTSSGGGETFRDFGDPIVEAPAPGDAPALFGDPSSGASSGGPCLVEPEPGTLFPRNWLRPRFSWVGGDSNLFELRLSAQNQSQDLFVYTVASSWTMPKPMWDALREHSADVP